MSPTGVPFPFRSISLYKGAAAMSSITFNASLPDFCKNPVKLPKFEVQFVYKYDKSSSFLYVSSQFPAVKFLHFAQKLSPAGGPKSLFAGADLPFFALLTGSYIICNSARTHLPLLTKDILLIIPRTPTFLFWKKIHYLYFRPSETRRRVPCRTLPPRPHSSTSVTPSSAMSPSGLSTNPRGI